MSATESTRRTSSRIANRALPSDSTTKGSEGAKASSSKKRSAPVSKSNTNKETTSATATKKSKSETSTNATATATTSSTSKAGILNVGDALPNISLKDEAGNEVNVSTLKKTVIFTYPKANTGGCTTQACLFRDEYAEWTKLGFAVFGLSNDSQISLKNWKEKKGFQYHLLSDPKRDLILTLTGSNTQTRRSHFVIDGNGKLALSSISVKPAESSPAALKFAKSL